ncbi:MliC family protein [Neolewinella antarctica]|uniref:Membrane-bound inhibitor of C-type lysozyme n=1 Tax=Neolewinella antarctica TaxID=442734 RepID=A0ABX0XD86_9BACT|nr:MliC family protein [Neolewinella antarctica]NJC27172.1 membrane-bound inhibitor of C-type lysozyme [Neolewinella antarctica]
MITIIKLLAILLVISVTATSCNKQMTQANANTIETMADNKVKQSLTDKAGNQLDLTFDNNRDVVSVDFMGETAELAREKSASGMWYKNDRYELIGKSSDLQLKKDGKTVFEHEDDIVQSQAKSDNGDVLDLTFNNTQGTLQAYLNGGEQIDMTAERAGSGFWYKNDQYELRGKGESMELTKDGNSIFKN